MRLAQYTLPLERLSALLGATWATACEAAQPELAALRSQLQALVQKVDSFARPRRSTKPRRQPCPQPAPSTQSPSGSLWSRLCSCFSEAQTLSREPTDDEIRKRLLSILQLDQTSPVPRAHVGPHLIKRDALQMEIEIAEDDSEIGAFEGTGGIGWRRGVISDDQTGGYNKGPWRKNCPPPA